MRVATPKTILIVDDDPYFGELLARAIAAAVPSEIRLVVARSSEAALAHLDGIGSSVVVVVDDELGSRMGGVELLREVHEREPAHHRILMTRRAAGSAHDPAASETHLKPTWLDASQPLLRAIVDRVAPARA